MKKIFIGITRLPAWLRNDNPRFLEWHEGIYDGIYEEADVKKLMEVGRINWAEDGVIFTAYTLYRDTNIPSFWRRNAT